MRNKIKFILTCVLCVMFFATVTNAAKTNNTASVMIIKTSYAWTKDDKVKTKQYFHKYKNEIIFE